MRTRTIGDVTVTSVVEAEGSTAGTFLFPEANPVEVARRHRWARGTFVDDDGRLDRAGGPGSGRIVSTDNGHIFEAATQ